VQVGLAAAAAWRSRATESRYPWVGGQRGVAHEDPGDRRRGPLGRQQGPVDMPVGMRVRTRRLARPKPRGDEDLAQQVVQVGRRRPPAVGSGGGRFPGRGDHQGLGWQLTPLAEALTTGGQIAAHQGRQPLGDRHRARLGPLSDHPHESVALGGLVAAEIQFDQIPGAQPGAEQQAD
jgi:hypothetical protein